MRNGKAFGAVFLGLRGLDRILDEEPAVDAGAMS